MASASTPSANEQVKDVVGLDGPTLTCITVMCIQCGLMQCAFPMRKSAHVTCMLHASNRQ